MIAAGMLKRLPPAATQPTRGGIEPITDPGMTAWGVIRFRIGIDQVVPYHGNKPKISASKPELTINNQ